MREEELALLRKEANTWKEKHDIVKAELDDRIMRNPADRGGKARYSARQGLGMALRAAMTSASAIDFGVSQAVDVATTTVLDWKARLNDA